MTDRPTEPTDGPERPVRHVTGEDEFDRLLANDERVLVDFYADWCGPCQIMAPVVAELAAETDATVAKVDTESLPQVATRYDVRSIPTFVAFRDGVVEERLVGMHEKAALAEAVE